METLLNEAHKIMLHKLQGYEIICEIKSRHHVQDMRPGVSRLNTLSQVDRIGIPFSGRPVHRLRDRTMSQNPR